MLDRAADGSGKGEGGYLLIPAYPKTLPTRIVPSKVVDDVSLLL